MFSISSCDIYVYHTHLSGTSELFIVLTCKTTLPVVQLLSRVWNGPNRVLAGKQAEQKMISILKNKFPNAKLIEVNDVSGGCGAMFEINVVAAEFKGLNTIKQHRMINEALKEEIKDMHGIRIYTSVPEP